ncbi:MAG: hypothetical protein ACLRQA_00395 [Anaerovoracaceae bacterium]
MKFTVEELALKVQQGEKEYMPQLWESVNRFISMQARRTLNGYPDHYKELLPDMVNEAYFALLKAVQDFEAGKGMFLTYLGYHIKNAFTTVLYCGRGIRHKNDPLNTASSLDEPLKDSEELTLVDMLIDDTAEAYYRRIEDNDFWLSVNELLNEAIGHIRDNKGREIVRYMFDNECTIKEASRVLFGDANVPYENYSRALYQMQSYLSYSTVKGKMRATGLDDYIYGWGAGAWKNHSFTSSVEYMAIKHVDEQMKRDDIAEMIL